MLPPVRSSRRPHLVGGVLALTESDIQLIDDTTNMNWQQTVAKLTTM